MASRTENQSLALIKSNGWFLPIAKKRDRKGKMVYVGYEKNLKEGLTDFFEIKNQYLALIKSTNLFATRKNQKFDFRERNSINVINVEMLLREVDNHSGLESQVFLWRNIAMVWKENQCGFSSVDRRRYFFFD